MPLTDFREPFKIVYKIYLQSRLAGTHGNSFSGFARCLGVSYGRVQTWREGKRWPGSEDIVLMHDRLGLSYQWLLTGTGEPLERDAASARDATSARDAASEREEALQRQVAALEQELLGLHRELSQTQKKLIEVLEHSAPGDAWEKIPGIPMAAPEIATGAPPRGAASSRASKRARNDA